MNNNKIVIELQLRENQKYQLILTPSHYKEEFKQFIAQHKISTTHAYYIKNLVQAKMIDLYKGYASYEKKRNMNELSHTVSQSWYEPKQSPKFGKIGEQKETQTFLIDHREVPEEKYFKKQDKMSKQSLFSTNLPSIAVNNVTHKIQQNQQKIQPHDQSLFKQEEEEQKYILHYKHHRQLSSPCMSSPKKQIQQPVNTPSTKYKSSRKDSMTDNFDRLHQTSTESFRNKKRNDINHKELDDYREVEKYTMNQHLKRTTQDFFNHLHSQSTASFEGKRKKQEVSPKEIQQSPPAKKVSLSKSFKGSKWNSGSRCGMKILVEQQKKLQEAKRKKEEQVKTRVKQRLKNKSHEDHKNEYKSRSCQKCNPKTPQKKKKIIEATKKMPQPIKTAPRPYINNLLMDCYNQFSKEISYF